MGWSIPNPHIDVWFKEGNINAYDWPLNTVLTLEVEASNPPDLNPEYSTTTTVGPAPWDPNQRVGEFRLNGAFEILPGMQVTVAGGDFTRQLFISNLTITSADPVTDIITGTSEPDRNMWMWIPSPTCCRNFQADANGDWVVNYSQTGPNSEPIEDIQPGWSGTANVPDGDGDNTSLNWRVPNRHVIADGAGNWVADFGHVGVQSDEQTTLDLLPGFWVDSQQNDTDGDRTMFGRNIPNPRIEVAPYSDWIHAREWPLGTLITMTIDNPSNGKGVDLTQNGTMVQAPWNPADPSDILADFRWPDQFTPGEGYIITMSGGGTAETYTVTNLYVTSADVDTDTVLGVASPGAKVQVCVNFPDHCAARYVTADLSGNWTADYS